MKKLIFIGALFISQINFGQLHTFQVFADQEEMFEETSGNLFQIVEPFRSFLMEHGYYWEAFSVNLVLFDDDPGDHIFPMFVVAEQANALEDLLIISDLVYKYIEYNDETTFLLDRLIFKYYLEMTPEFLGIQNGVVVTDHEPLNILFEAFQVDNYEQSFPISTVPNNLTYYNLRCNGCDIFQLVQEIINIEIVEDAELLEHEQVLSFEEIEELNGVLLSPNPNNGNFTLQIKDPRFSDAELIIYDALGRAVYEEKLEQQQNSIRLQGLESGLYFTQITSGEKRIVKKFVVN